MSSLDRYPVQVPQKVDVGGRWITRNVENSIVKRVLHSCKSLREEIFSYRSCNKWKAHSSSQDGFNSIQTVWVSKFKSNSFGHKRVEEAFLNLEFDQIIRTAHTLLTFRSKIDERLSVDAFKMCRKLFLCNVSGPSQKVQIQGSNLEIAWQRDHSIGSTALSQA